MGDFLSPTEVEKIKKQNKRVVVDNNFEPVECYGLNGNDIVSKAIFSNKKEFFTNIQFKNKKELITQFDKIKKGKEEYSTMIRYNNNNFSENDDDNEE